MIQSGITHIWGVLYWEDWMNKPLLVGCYGLSEVSYTNLGEAETAVQALANCRFLRLQRMEDLPSGF